MSDTFESKKNGGWPRWLLVGAMVVFIAVYWFSQRIPENHIAWTYKLANAKQQAADSGVPMLLYFTADWCPPCKQMKRKVWPDKGVEELVNHSTVPVYINVDEQPQVAHDYGVDGIPTIILAHASGEPVMADPYTPIMSVGFTRFEGIASLIKSAAAISQPPRSAAPLPPPPPAEAN